MSSRSPRLAPLILRKFAALRLWLLKRLSMRRCARRLWTLCVMLPLLLLTLDTIRGRLRLRLKLMLMLMLITVSLLLLLLLTMLPPSLLLTTLLLLLWLTMSPLPPLPMLWPTLSHRHQGDLYSCREQAPHDHLRARGDHRHSARHCTCRCPCGSRSPCRWIRTRCCSPYWILN